MSEYAVAAGYIQFDVKEREVNGQDVRDIAIRALGTQKRVSITVWPDHASVPLEKGDFVVAEGKFQAKDGEKDGEPVTYYNLSASSLLVIPQAAKAERETVNKKKESSQNADGVPF